MNLQPPLRLDRIAEITGCVLEQGAPEIEVRALRSVDAAGPGELSFVSDAKRAARYLAASAAGALILPPGMDAPAGVAVLRTDDVQHALALLLAALKGPADLPPVGVDARAAVAEDAIISPGAAVGALAHVGAGAVIEAGAVVCSQAYVGRDARLGADSILYPGARLLDGCIIGRRCRIHCNAVIGADGFGYYHRDGVHHKIEHAGNVVIEDDVEIGANSCVDRAKFGSTFVGAGTKLDNLVQIAHGAQLGQGVLMAALVGIAGSATIGDYCVFGGHAAVRDNVNVGPGVQLAAFSAIHNDVEPKQKLFGTPAIPARQYMRVLPVLHKLPQLREELRQVQAKLDALEQAAKNDS